MENIDLLIAGAGPVGCVVAERAANVLGWRCLIVERRDHIAGNCYDAPHESGVLVHRYGPHYFRTNSQALLDYLSKFTAWIPGNYVVKSSVGGKLYPFPINLDTLEQFFGRPLDADSARALLEAEREKIAEPRNSEEFVCARVGRRLYEAFYLNYTLKQWDRHPRDLDPSVCGRIPVRFDRRNTYVDHRFQVTPARGFTALFAKMIDHPLIEVKLGADFREVRAQLRPRRATVYCGTPDEYFDHRFGPLAWRSLSFRFEARAQEFVQPCVQINYPNEHAYTRTLEIKHVTGQKHPHTVLSYETPQATGEPYYPIPSPETQARYRQYEALAQRAQREDNVFFAGRLATYRYINTDQAIESALETFEALRGLAA